MFSIYINGAMDSSTPFHPIRTGRLYEQVVAQIEQQILDGDLQAGDKLPAENELAELFGVSRTSVREAIKSLVQKGLVEVRRGRGTFVVDSTSDVVKSSLGRMVRFGQAEGLSQLVAVRELLEPGIAARAAAHATEETIRALQHAIETMDDTLEDPQAFIAADHEFHLALAAGTQNELMLALVDSIVELLQEQRIRIYHVDQGPQRGQYHHKQIFRAVKAGDPEAARKAMEDHLQQVRDDSMESIEHIEE